MLPEPGTPSLRFGWAVAGSPLEVEADVLIVPAVPGDEVPSDPWLAELAGIYRAAGRSGAVGEDLLVTRRPDDAWKTAAVLLVGVGDEHLRTPDLVERLARKIGRAHGDSAVLATTLHQICAGAGAAVLRGLATGSYRFDHYRSVSPRTGRVEQVLLVTPDAPSGAQRSLLHEAEVVESAQSWVRDLVNLGPGDLPPKALAGAADALRGLPGVAVRLRDVEELRAEGCGGILAVGQGSHHPPVLVEATYEPLEGTPRRRVHVIGKGITFDSGGLSLKKSAEMLDMKSDMAGGAVALAVVRTLAELQRTDVAVTAWVPAAENMPGGGAIRPGDVVTHRGGTTSEVADTDCEGRLVMADALALAVERAPDYVIDVATLTYACVTAVGSRITVAMGNDQALVDAARSSGTAVGEPLWQLPLWQPYLPLVSSTVADVRNEGPDDSPGCITSALFLQHFVGDTPWLHLDIGGTAWVEEADDEWAAGGTGAMLRTLVDLLTTEHPDTSPGPDLATKGPTS